LPRRSSKLREVFVNIVQNAIDELASVPDRARMLRLQTSYVQRSRVSIVIEDSGRGITSERLPNLFTAFVSTKTRGMGIGLSLCQMIIDATTSSCPCRPR
jgi:C4-dicarboxylate-specific signal transduction histidine kinase